MFTLNEQERYVKQVALCEWGWEAQEKVKKSSVLVIGAGALGCAALPYLVSGGIGKIGIVDRDRVERSNLHRQPLYTEADIGALKVDVAIQKLALLNPHTEFISCPFFLDEENGFDLIRSYDLILDATDRFSSRLTIDTVCYELQKPWIHASLERFTGQVIFFSQSRYADLFPGLSDTMATSCSAEGVLGPLPGVLGTMQALQALQWLGGIGANLPGKWIRIDALTWRTQVLTYSTPITKDTLSVTELLQWMKEGRDFILVDLRRPEERVKGNIEGISITSIDNIPKNQTMVLYCQTGIRSAAAVKRLKERNISAYSLEGGYEGFLITNKIA
jgi:adenylyltransferase/sulfurtransferase